MSVATTAKIQARHLGRNAYLYVRQSTIRQVFENTESTRRQYELRERAVSLGWPVEQVVVIDTDQGHSGASAADREGFQRLVAEVGMGRAGIVMGLEVSRLARNSTDWHRLLEICALTDTLILDEDGVYDPAHFNDRLLLGLKGTMSEAELHVLRARLRGGILNQARRGELQVPLPVGFVYDPEGQVKLHPDARVRETVRHLFETFWRHGSAFGVVRAFRRDGLLFPRRPQDGPRDGDLVWDELSHARTVHILKNPRYAGAFCFGRTRQRKRPEGGVVYERLAREEWVALIPDAHEGYITWTQFEENLRRLKENANARGAERRNGPPREGPALLQGLAVCAVCGQRMTVRYHQRQGQRAPEYVCQKRGIERAEPVCQLINGVAVDEAIGALLVQSVTPVSLEVAMAVQQELEQRDVDADRLRLQAVEQARYEAELARRRYMKVDPDNRLVADTLEADWNAKLRSVAEAQALYEQQRQTAGATLDEAQRAAIMALATDFPRLWADPKTPDRERKRMARLLIEDVTLLKRDEVTANVRFRGGATRTLQLPLPKPGWKRWETPSEVVSEIDRLLEAHTHGEIAELLNQRGRLSGKGGRFTRNMVRGIRINYGHKSRYDRLRERGMLDQHELGRRLDVTAETIRKWRRSGYLIAHRYSDKPEYLYPVPEGDGPVRGKHNKQHVSGGSRRNRRAQDGGRAV